MRISTPWSAYFTSKKTFRVRVVQENVGPFLKWAGGKRQIAQVIKSYVPKFKRYFEPFLGGGAVFFTVQPMQAVLNDLNSELINVYKVIRDSPEELIASLKKHENTAEYFYRIRSLDRDPLAYSTLSPVERASRFIYLNKTCFNGLFRVNKKGHFNAPFGRYKSPKIADESLIWAVSRLLLRRDVVFASLDFAECLKDAEEGDFVYLDPPYDPVSETARFTNYSSLGFGREDQLRLKEVCDWLDQRGVKFVLSNSNTEFIRSLYASYEIRYVRAGRAINCDPRKRGKVVELLIKNY